MKALAFIAYWLSYIITGVACIIYYGLMIVELKMRYHVTRYITLWKEGFDR